VKLKDNVKIVTLRSTFNVENSTLVPVELAIVDANGKRASEIYKIGQGMSGYETMLPLTRSLQLPAATVLFPSRLLTTTGSRFGQMVNLERVYLFIFSSHSILRYSAAGFGYAWYSESLYWQDLIKRPARSIACKSNENEAPFRFQAYTVHDCNDPLIRYDLFSGQASDSS
jgi:vacuolar protein sorting-associated protein 13A/C